MDFVILYGSTERKINDDGEEGAGNGFLSLPHKHHTQGTCSVHVEFLLVRFDAFFTSFFLFSPSLFYIAFIVRISAIPFIITCPPPPRVNVARARSW